MDLNSILVSEFAKITNDNKETVNEGTTVYGTYRVDGDGAYVQIDGSDTRTPVATTSEARNGDRVTVLIKNHRAIITGNLTDPSTTVKSVEERIETGVGNIQKTIDDLKTQLDNQEITLDDYRKAIAEAKRMATDYIDFTAGTGLVIGSSAISSNVRIYSGGIDIRDGDTILASYTDDYIYLGYGNRQATIDLCSGLGTIKANYDETDNVWDILSISSVASAGLYGSKAVILESKNSLTGNTAGVFVSSNGNSHGVSLDVLSGTTDKQTTIAIYPGEIDITAELFNSSAPRIYMTSGYGELKNFTISGYSKTGHTHSQYYESGDNINVGKITSSYTYGDTVDYSTNMYVGTSGILHRTTKTSSRTVKHDIKPIENSDILPEKLYDVDVIQFVYNEGQLGHSSKRYGKELPGFIVEDLVEKYPIAVDIDEEDKPFQWNEQYLIPPMLSLIQKQKKKLDELESRINALEKKEV